MPSIRLSVVPRILTGLLLLALSACSSTPSGEFVECYLRNPDQTSSPMIRAELAQTPSETKLGLMYRKSMPHDQGMLFVFEDEQPRSFWMKNTYIPLDIIYFSAEKKIVSIRKRTTPLSTKTQPSEKPAKYVLEVNAGLADEWKLREGSELVITDDDAL